MLLLWREEGVGVGVDMGDSTRGPLGEEVICFSFGVPSVNEDLLPRFERVLEGCGVRRSCRDVDVLTVHGRWRDSGNEREKRGYQVDIRRSSLSFLFVFVVAGGWVWR